MDVDEIMSPNLKEEVKVPTKEKMEISDAGTIVTNATSTRFSCSKIRNVQKYEEDYWRNVTQEIGGK